MNKYDYKNISPFKWFVLENFPFIEDDFDALTNWQLFCKIGKQINKIIESQNEVGHAVEDFTEKFIELNNYVHDYFNNLDVQEEINNKLDTMASDGTLDQLLLPYFNAYKNEINQEISVINHKVDSVANGSPLVASSINEMTDTSKTYVNTSDGYWYYYNGTTWVRGGVYQAKILPDSSVQLNNLNKILSDFYSYNYSDYTILNDNINWLENQYYNREGSLQNITSTNCCSIPVNKGEIYHINGYGASNALAYLLTDGTSVIALSDTGNVNDFVIIPENVTTLLINYWKNRPIPTIYKINNIDLNNNIKLNLLNDIENCIVAQNFSSYHSGLFFKYITFSIPRSDLIVNSNDVITIELDVCTKKPLQNCVFFQDTTSSYGSKISGTKYGDKYLYHISFKFTSTNDLLDCSFILSPSFSQSTSDIAFMYNVQINNITRNTTLTNLYNYLTSGATIETMNLMSFILSDSINNYIHGFLPLIKNKKIICAGDSLTHGYNGATNSYVDYLSAFYIDSDVENRGHNGWTAAGLLPELCNMADKQNYYGPPSSITDYTDVIAVIINMGTNGGVSGSIETSIPQLSNATDLEGNPLSNITINQVIDSGIKYNGVTIDTAEKYWNLFSDNWYGNMALTIEYITWKNPKTKIFLLPPCVNSISGRANYLNITNAMIELANYYGISFIDINNSLGINSRNYKFYTLPNDNCHGTNLRNEMVGSYIARYISNKIY